MRVERCADIFYEVCEVCKVCRDAESLQRRMMYEGRKD